MDYSPEALDALVQEVESQGGALLPDKCRRHAIKFTAPPYNAASVHEKATCGCGNETVLVSTYDPALKKRQGGSGFATACGVCDDMGAWPRYCDAVNAADPDMNRANQPDEDDEDY